MSRYLLINTIIIFFPLALSFIPYFNFYKKLVPLLISIIIVGIPFIIWDIIFTARLNWVFNPIYISGIKLWDLPIEELLFFITVPYSCIFLYEGLVKFFKDKEVKFNKNIYLLTGVLFAFFSLFFYNKEYTKIMLQITALFMVVEVIFFEKFLKSLLLWIWLLLGMLLFVLFNFILTSLPVVVYNPSVITNIKLLTIPMEDFFYNFVMLSSYLIVYLKAKKFLNV